MCDGKPSAATRSWLVVALVWWVLCCGGSVVRAFRIPDDAERSGDRPDSDMSPSWRTHSRSAGAVQSDSGAVLDAWRTFLPPPSPSPPTSDSASASYRHRRRHHHHEMLVHRRRTPMDEDEQPQADDPRITNWAPANMVSSSATTTVPSATRRRNHRRKQARATTPKKGQQRPAHGGRRTQPNRRRPGGGGRGRQLRKQSCQPQDYLRSAFQAPIVVKAQATSQTINSTYTFGVTFRVEEVLKGGAFVTLNESIRVTFLSNRRHQQCEPATLAQHMRLASRHGAAVGVNSCHQQFVRARIQTQHRYFLFLASCESHEVVPVANPVPSKNASRAAILEVVSPKFVPTKTALTLQRRNNTAHAQQHVEYNDRLRLECEASGHPLPVLNWRLNNETVYAKSNITRIFYREIERRKKITSVLVVKKMDDRHSGRYECVANLGGAIVGSEYLDFPITKREPCNSSMASFCQNGSCFVDMMMNEMYCRCSDGYSGPHCSMKNPSMPVLNNHPLKRK